MSPVAFPKVKYPIRFKFFHYGKHMGYPQIAAQMVHTFHTSHFKYESPYRRVANVNAGTGPFKLVLESTGQKPIGQLTVTTTASDVALPVSIHAVPEHIYQPKATHMRGDVHIFLIPLDYIPLDAATYALPSLMLGNGDLRNPHFIKVLPALLKQVLENFHIIIKIRSQLLRPTPIHYSATFRELQGNRIMQEKILHLLASYTTK